jgi:putative flavoprotein involved in K+ transport
MDAAGVLDERYDQVDDIARARRVPSLQLAGTPDRSTLNLNTLTDNGVRLVGRLAGITEDGKALLVRDPNPRRSQNPINVGLIRTQRPI